MATSNSALKKSFEINIHVSGRVRLRGYSNVESCKYQTYFRLSEHSIGFRVNLFESLILGLPALTIFSFFLLLLLGGTSTSARFVLVWAVTSSRFSFSFLAVEDRFVVWTVCRFLLRFDLTLTPVFVREVRPLLRTNFCITFRFEIATREKFRSRTRECCLNEKHLFPV